MGKHGAVVGRKQVPIPAVALGVVLLVGIVTGAWWWSLGTPSDPIDQNPVAATAFVVSSPSCTDRGTGTVVDLSPASGGQARAVIEGCGYSDGQQMAVEYLAGDPSQARLAGTSSSSGNGVRQWWPVVLGILAVLAAGIVVVLVVDGGRFRRPAGSPTRSRDGASPDRQVQGPALTAMVSTTADPAAPSLAAVDAVVGGRRGGRHALLELDDQQLDDEESAYEESAGAGWLLNTNDDGWLLDPAQSWAAEISVGGDGQMWPDDDESLQFRLDLVFPSTAELAASLQDELFTHRHVQVSGG